MRHLIEAAARGGCWPAAILILATACGGELESQRPPAPLAGEQVMEASELILGHWEKTTRDVCAATYPEALEFRRGGIYMGRSPAFSLWQGGDYELLGEGEIKIQSANDAMLLYAFTVSDKSLVFRDQDGCEFEYRRAGARAGS